MGTSPPLLLATLSDLARGIFDRYAASQGKRRWIDKTPNYYRLLPLIEQLFRREILYVFVTRHPGDTIASLAAAPFFADDCLEDPDISRAVARYGRTRVGWARYWTEVNDTLMAFAPARADRIMWLRYEDLLASPELALNSVFQFLGEGTPQGVIDHAFQMRHTAGYGDWKIGDARTIARDRVDRWTDWPAEDVAAVRGVTATLCAQLGYSM
jgi:hypothetical protein